MKPTHPSPPISVESLKQLIVTRQVKHTAALKLVLEVGFAEPEVIAFGSRASICDKCGVSPSSVARMLNDLGYRSFSEFRGIFRAHLLKRSLAGVAS
jgi:DNA-binding MurR/RpiR family transcriptional regulator